MWKADEVSVDVVEDLPSIDISSNIPDFSLENWQANIVDLVKTPTFIVYKVCIQVENSRWHILRRYVQFYTLYQTLREQTGFVCEDFPPKLWFFQENETDEQLARLRVSGLNSFLAKVIAHKRYCMHTAALEFFKPVRDESQIQTQISFGIRFWRLEHANLFDPLETGDDFTPILYRRRTPLVQTPKITSTSAASQTASDPHTGSVEGNATDEESEEEDEHNAEEIARLRSLIYKLESQTHKRALTMNEKNMLKAAKEKLRSHYRR